MLERSYYINLLIDLPPKNKPYKPNKYIKESNLWCNMFKHILHISRYYGMRRNVNNRLGLQRLSLSIEKFGFDFEKVEYGGIVVICYDKAYINKENKYKHSDCYSIKSKCNNIYDINTIKNLLVTYINLYIKIITKYGNEFNFKSYYINLNNDNQIKLLNRMKNYFIN